MPTATLTQLIDCPLPHAYATVIDLTTFPAWNPTTKSATKLTEGRPTEGTRFEMSIAGFGTQMLELQGFEDGREVTLVPESKMFEGGHRFVFTAEGDKTRIDHELVMNPRGIFKVLSPMMGMMSRKNLRQTADALQRHFERS